METVLENSGDVPLRFDFLMNKMYRISLLLFNHALYILLNKFEEKISEADLILAYFSPFLSERFF